MSLERPLAYFKKNQKKFAAEHHGEFAVIHGKEAEGFYEDQLEAYTSAKKKYPAGSFLLRPCIRPEEEDSPKFHSRVAG